jgi:hypothetical protein
LIYDQDEKSLVMLLGIAMLDLVSIHAEEADLPDELKIVQKDVLEEL